jgi:hypothetical protein
VLQDGQEEELQDVNNVVVVVPRPAVSISGCAWDSRDLKGMEIEVERMEIEMKE